MLPESVMMYRLLAPGPEADVSQIYLSEEEQVRFSRLHVVHGNLERERSVRWTTVKRVDRAVEELSPSYNFDVSLLMDIVRESTVYASRHWKIYLRVFASCLRIPTFTSFGKITYELQLTRQDYSTWSTELVWLILATICSARSSWQLKLKYCIVLAVHARFCICAKTDY